MPRLLRGYNRFDAWLEALCFEKHLVPISIIIIVIVVLHNQSIIKLQKSRKQMFLGKKRTRYV